MRCQAPPSQISHAVCFRALFVHGPGRDVAGRLNVGSEYDDSQYSSRAAGIATVVGVVLVATVPPVEASAARVAVPDRTAPEAGAVSDTVGTTATVVGYPNKTESDELRAERITIGTKTTELR